MGRQGTNRKGTARPDARARQEHRAHQGLRERLQGAVAVSASRRTHAFDGRGISCPQARLPAQREEPRLLGVRPGLAIYGSEALRLVPRLPRGWTLTDVG